MKKKFTKILGVVTTVALLTSLALVAVPVSADVSQPQVSLDDTTISTTTEYTILFSVTEAIPDAITSYIEVEFPDDTTLGPFTTLGDVEVQTTAGFGTANINTQISAADVTVDDQTVTIVTDDLLAAIGEFAQVKVTFTDDVTNPDDVGDYTLTVATSEETDAVESAPYEIEAPDITVPGIVTVINSSGLTVAQYVGDGAIADSIAVANEDFTIMFGPGTYTCDGIDDTFDTLDDGVTFEASGAADDTILEGDFNIDAADIVIDGITFRGEMYIDGENVLIKDCIFEKLDDSASETLVEYEFSGDGTIEDCIFDTTEGNEDDVGLYINYDGLTVSNCSFIVDEEDWGIEAYYDATIEDCEFTGDSGIGVYLEDDIVSITGCTFDGLMNAIYVYWADVGSVIANNTIMDSTGDAIYIEDTDTLAIVGNTISDTDEDFYALFVEDGDAEHVYFVLNNVTDNELNVCNEDADELNATNNWWGDAAGPDADSIEGEVATDPVLGSEIAGATAVAASDELDAEDEAGAKISTDATAGNEPGVMAVAAYKANPGEATPYPAVAGSSGFFDVYVSDPGDADEITIRLYGDVTENTKAFVWSELAGEWLECSNQDANSFSGYVYVTIEEDDTVPTFEELAAVPFALLGAPPDLEVAVTLTSPDPGALDVVRRPILAWDPITDAMFTVEVARDSGFLAVVFSDTISNASIAITSELEWDTDYYWRVMATVDGEDYDWSTGAFRIMAEPEPEPEPTPPVIITPPADPTPPVVLPAAPAPITPGWIYAIIGVGAVLVIAVIVLIVTTRRATP